MGKKILIVGGGIIGLSSAYYLWKEGHEVTVIDKSEICSGASFVNAGYLVPSHFIPLAAPGMISQGIRYIFNSASPFYIKPRLNQEFLKWAWYFKKSCTPAKVRKAAPVIRDMNLLSKQLFESLHTSGEIGNFHLKKEGLLMVYQTEKYRELEKKNAAWAKALDLDVKHLDAAALASLDPNSECNALGAFHYLCDAHTTPSEFMRRMTSFLEGVGVNILTKEEVLDFERTDNTIKQVVTNKNTYHCDEVVLAAGSWSAQLTKKLKWDVPLQPGKGYCIDVNMNTGITMPVLLCEAKIAVTPMKGFTRFAGTMEFSGINHQIHTKRVLAIAEGVKKYYPGLDIPEDAVQTAKCGLRPVSPDGLPYIGRSEKIKNFVVATGHAMMGWSLGPATGKLISELVSYKKESLDISLFHPERKF
ncbi:MAG: FAD-dependent oxidoreductase [Bacteroidota bacterium]